MRRRCMNRDQARSVRHEIDQNSDGLFKSAVQLAERHRPLSSSQANGLMAVVNGEDNINTVLTNYIQRQGTKSTKREEEKAFWSDLKKEMDGLRKQAEAILQNLGWMAADKKTQQDQRNQIHLWLARDYVQHLVAHIIYKSKMTGED